MNVRSVLFFALALTVFCAASGGVASADPLPDEIIKFRQWPLNNGATPVPIAIVGAPFFGHDELSTATLVPGQNFYEGRFMADDFADKFNSPVVHVRWWGSYLNDSLPTNSVGVQRFLISFENDVPAGPNNPFSHPGTEQFNQIVTSGPLAPGTGTFTRKLVPTPGPAAPPEALFEYNAELHMDQQFPEKASTVYWLKIVALVDPVEDGPLQWGWHNRDWSIPDAHAAMPPGDGPIGGVFVPGPAPTTLPVYHFQDDAVTGRIQVFPIAATPAMPNVVQDQFERTSYQFPVDGPDGIQQFSKDLAFELYTTVPEPAPTLMAVIGLSGLGGRLRCRNQRIYVV